MFEYKALAPNFRLLDNFKRKKITEEKFVSEYNEMLSELDASNVLEKNIASVVMPIGMDHKDYSK